MGLSVGSLWADGVDVVMCCAPSGHCILFLKLPCLQQVHFPTFKKLGLECGLKLVEHMNFVDYAHRALALSSRKVRVWRAPQHRYMSSLYTSSLSGNSKVIGEVAVSGA